MIKDNKMFCNQESRVKMSKTCWLDKDRHQIVRRYSLIRVFVVNIMGSLSFFSMFLFVVIN